METCTHIAGPCVDGVRAGERCTATPTGLNSVGRPVCDRHSGVSYAELAEVNEGRRRVGLPAL